MKKILILAMCLAIVPMLFASQRNLERSADDVDVAAELKMLENTLQESGDRARKIPEDAFDVLVSSRQLLWDFEDGWQGWTNTNGNAFPYAWGVERYNLNGSYWVCPDAGDSSMWIDSDAAGYGYWLEDTVQSPLLFPIPSMHWLKYGLAFNRLSYYEYLEVGIKYFDGATWTVVPLKTYTADFRGWDQVDVSAYAGYPSVQIYFFYIDRGRWCWYGAFDNVSIDASLTPPIVWDFETGWQGWTHTNGLSFPGGWEPYDATYRSGWYYQCPSSDDSSMCIDSDLYFGATMDTAFSPFLVPLPDMEWLDYGFFYNDLATHFDYFEVGIKYFDGSTWTVDTLRMYDSDYYGNWESIDVSAYSTYDLIQLYFYYHAPGWDYYAAFDNVSFGFGVRPAEHDVGCDQVASPPAGTALPGDYDVIGNIKDFGDFIETFDATATVYDTLAGWIVVFKTTLTLTNFSPGAESLVNFGMVTLENNKVYYTEIYTDLVGDEHPENDTTTATCVTSTLFWEILTDMPHTASGAYVGYSMDAASNTYVHVFGGNPSAQALHYIYDVTNASWSAGTPLPTGATYGGYCSIDNKIYMIGAWTTGPGALITIYDADSDIYTTVPLPSGETNDPGIAVKDNNYIYIVGGGGGWSGRTVVNVFDVAGDSFLTNVTQLPTGDAKMSAGTAMITGDTIVVAAGYGASSSEDKVLLGAIDPANPANITWTTGPAYPGGATYRLSADSWEGVGYFTCGSGPLASTYAYVAGTGWVTLPDKPTALMNVGFVMAAVDISLVDDVEGCGFACGGYSPYMSTFEALHTGVITGIAEKPDEGSEILKFSFKLLTSNPVTNTARIQFVMPTKGPVSFSVYDVTGRTVMTRNFSSISRGTHTVIWKCNDNAGKKVASGSYFYRLESGENVATGKLIILR